MEEIKNNDPNFKPGLVIVQVSIKYIIRETMRVLYEYSITHCRHNCLVFIWYISDITGSLKRAPCIRNTCNLVVGEEGVRRDFLVSGRFNTFASLILAEGGCSGTTWE